MADALSYAPAVVDPSASPTTTFVHSDGPAARCPSPEQGHGDPDALEKGQADDSDSSSCPPKDDEKASSEPRRQKEVELEDQSNLLPRRQVITVFLCLSSGIFMAVLDQSIIATALPSINSDFHSGSTSTFVATAYLITGTAVQPLYGRLSDIFGRKVMMLTALGIFAVGSLACALAQSIGQLIAFRAVAGVGGGAVMSLSMIIISDGEALPLL